MNDLNIKIKGYFRFFCLLLFALCSLNVYSQSVNQNSPTSVTTNEISGNILARDVGDARLTTYFYGFRGVQGDVFINVLTKNLNGSIDVFTTDNLRLLTKIIIYANDTETETGRVIYLRKPEKLILRVEGRSPNDDAATFRVKFAGSFEPLEMTAENDAPPEVKTDNQTNIRVNSVGTILEIKPKAGEIAAKKIEDNKTETDVRAENREPATESKLSDKIPEVVGEKIHNEPITPVPNETAPQNKIESEKMSTENKVDKTGKTETAISAVKSKSKKVSVKAESVTKKGTKSASKEKIVEPNPLENIRLVVLFKDGKKIEYSMSEVSKVGVDKGILTINSKTGGNVRYSILEVAKMTIE